MSITRPSASEIVSRGRAIYESQLREKLEREHFGEYLVIDVDTGEFDIDADRLSASKRAAARRPNGWRYAMRIGYPTGGRIGARSRVVSR